MDTKTMNCVVESYEIKKDADGKFYMNMRIELHPKEDESMSSKGTSFDPAATLQAIGSSTPHSYRRIDHLLLPLRSTTDSVADQ